MEASTSVIYVESNHMSQRKRTVIEILRESPDFVSGEAISDVLGISRNAVHKHIKSLRYRGYRILGISHRGYKLEEEPCRLAMPVVAKLTSESAFGHHFRYYDEIESTNSEARNLAAEGAPQGTVVIAECQSAGKGRLGRRWTSPAGKGLLFSVILRPNLTLSQAHLLTLVAATAACAGIERQTHIPTRIKWPNDLFIENKKVGGILLETAGERDEVEWIVVGIGINVNTEYSELPVALRRTAISLKMAGGVPVDRSELLASVLLSLERAYEDAAANGFERALRDFRERDYLLNKSVSVQTREGPVVGAASGIDEHGALLVELPHRQIRRFHSGEVSLR
jgi:BirA family biotin operon repressor/biotin-[acetyl-CoA-carboxylase] ligase